MINNILQCREITSLSLAKEMLTFLNVRAPKLVPMLGEEVGKFIDNPPASCNLAKDKRAQLCPYCFADHMLDKIKKLKIAEELKERLLILFSFSC